MKTVDIISYELNEINGLNRVTEKLAFGYKTFYANGIFLRYIVTKNSIYSCKKYKSVLGDNPKSYSDKRRKIEKLKRSHIYRTFIVQSVIQLFQYKRSKKVIRKYHKINDQADILVFQDIMAAYYAQQDKKIRSKIIVITHSDSDPLEQMLIERPEIKNTVTEQIIRKRFDHIFKYADKVITICHSEQQYQQEHYGVMAPCILNGIEDLSCKPKYRLGNIINIVILGSVIYRKGQDIAVKAISQLSEQEKRKVHLYIVGDGEYLTHIKKMIDELKLTKIVTCTGSKSNVGSFLNKMNVMLLPSRSDTVPIAIIEGLRSALPIISTDVGEIPYMIKGCGFIIKPDADSVKHIISYIIKNPHVLQQFSHNARQRYSNCFGLTKMIDNYSDVINNLK